MKHLFVPVSLLTQAADELAEVNEGVSILVEEPKEANGEGF